MTGQHHAVPFFCLYGKHTRILDAAADCVGSKGLRIGAEIRNTRNWRAAMNIEKTKNFNDFLEGALTEISLAELDTHSHNCPHCGILVRYPTVARQQDIDDFTKIMNSAFDVMRRHGITANLLAEIKAECFISIAKAKGEQQ
jgi:hypothetical protein